MRGRCHDQQERGGCCGEGEECPAATAEGKLNCAQPQISLLTIARLLVAVAEILQTLLM